jgi:UDP-2,3-diacylglucosamine hydrolase
MSRIALICAGGEFPLAVAKLCEKPFLILLKEANADLQSYPHITCGIAQIGRMIKAARANGCDKIAFVGSLVRPHIMSVIPDFYAIKQLPLALKAFKGGDNHLLTLFASIFEKEGLTLVGIDEIAPSLLAPLGVWGQHKPRDDDMSDIAHGAKALKAIGEFDIGQGLIISHKHIIAVEGAEGTDGLLARTAAMRETGRVTWKGKRGFLVKTLKENQDRRLDMPAIGIKTVENAVKAGLKGIAVEADGALVSNIQAVIRLADKEGIVLIGFTP